MTKTSSKPAAQQPETEQVDKQQVDTADAASKIAEFNPFLAELARLTTQYGAVVFDVNTKQGFEDSKKARADIREVRYAAQKAAVEILKPYQQKVKDAQEDVRSAKAIGEGLIDKILLLETPIDEQIKAEEKRVNDEKERLAAIERERVEAIQTKIASFRSVSVDYGSKTAQEIGAALESVQQQAIDEATFSEFEGEATIARDGAILQLETLHQLAVSREAEAERVANERRELDELREKQRVADQQAQAERERRAREDRERLDQQQAELQRMREELDAERKRVDGQRQELESKAAVVAVAAPAPAQVAVAPEPAGRFDADEPVQESPVADGAPTFQQIAEVVALGFDVSLDTATIWLKNING